MKKTAADKRAVLPRAADYASSFHKDWQRLSRSGRYDLNKLREVMLLLIGGETLGPEWSDRQLERLPGMSHRRRFSPDLPA